MAVQIRPMADAASPRCQSLARSKGSSIQDATKAIIQSHGLAALCRELLNANEFVYVD